MCEHRQMPAGRYYIGDPCYVFKDGWSKILGKTNYLNGPYPDDIKDKIWAHGTMYGDGGYFDQYGFEYGVDAGLIGVVHESLVEGRQGKMVNGS